MAYRLLYGDELLFDPYTSDVVTGGSLTAKTNQPDYLDFTIHPGHALYDVVAERGEDVRLWWGSTLLFRGTVETIETDMEGSRDVSCTGALAWLKSTVVRPYSTVAGEAALTAPATVDGLFAWYVHQHNDHVLDSRKQFGVGVNQGAALDANNYVLRSNASLPTTWDEIDAKILDLLGGYVTVDYDPLAVNLYADVHETNEQVIDLGVNVTDFTKSVSTADQYTAVRPTGATPEGETDAITIEGAADGPTGEPGISKAGDVVYSPDAVRRYGYRELAWSNTDCTTVDGLLSSACEKLAGLLSPALSVTVKAVDLALYREGYDHLRVGQAVRVRSALHDVDEYMTVDAIDLDLEDPGQTTYQLGVSYATLTGQQSGYLKALNGSIDTALDAVTASGAEARAAAETATGAAETAAAAATKADDAATAAGTATEAAQAAQTAAQAAQATADSKLDADAAAETYATREALATTDEKAQTAQTAADAATTAAQAAQGGVDALDTLIRETDEGVEVAKVDSSGAYSGYHTLVASDSFLVHDTGHDTVASFGATSATIGREGEQHATVDAGGLALYDGDGSRLASLGKSSVTLGEQDQAARIEMCGGVLGITTEDPGVSWNTRKTLIDATGTVYVSGVNNAGIASTATQVEQDTGTDVTATAAVDAISRTDGDFVYPQVELTAAETYTGASAGSRDARLNVSAEAVQSQVYGKDSSSSLLKQTTDALTFDGATVGLGQLELTDANALGATSSHGMQTLDAALSREERKLTKLWSGSVAKGGTITLARPIADYLVVAAVAANTATVLLGAYVPGYSRVTCSAQVDYGSSTGLLKLTFEVTGTSTLKFVSGSEHTVTSGISGAARTPAAFFGII